MTSALASSLCCSIFRHGVKYWFGPKVYSSVFPFKAVLNYLGWEVQVFHIRGERQPVLHLQAPNVITCEKDEEGQVLTFKSISLCKVLFPFNHFQGEPLPWSLLSSWIGRCVVRPSSDACWFVFSLFSSWEGREMEKGDGWSVALWAVTVSSRQ